MNLSPHTNNDFAESVAAPGHFAFRGPGGAIRAAGAMTALPRGCGDTIQDRIAHSLRDAGRDAVVGGALPFSLSQPDYLWRAERCEYHPTRAAVSVTRPADHILHAEPTAPQYAGSVSEALKVMLDESGSPDGLRKIVLARTLNVETQHIIDPSALMDRLGDDPSVTAFQVALPADGRETAPGMRKMIGATPELLLEKRGRRIVSHPLAGSARRAANPSDDAAASTGLAHSEKDHREHAIVVEYILDVLTPYCRNLSCPDGTTLTSTRSMWHLGSRIVGDLHDTDTPSAVLASALHPTPAVCGLPRDRAADLISRLETVPRGFYAGAVGWCDQRGDGAWYVAIRCADLCGRQARLFAGAGIVAGSDPQAEAAETGSKFAAVLRAMGLPADAAQS